MQDLLWRAAYRRAADFLRSAARRGLLFKRAGGNASLANDGRLASVALLSSTVKAVIASPISRSAQWSQTRHWYGDDANPTTSWGEGHAGQSDANYDRGDDCYHRPSSGLKR